MLYCHVYSDYELDFYALPTFVQIRRHFLFASRSRNLFNKYNGFLQNVSPFLDNLYSRHASILGSSDRRYGILSEMIFLYELWRHQYHKIELCRNHTKDDTTLTRHHLNIPLSLNEQLVRLPNINTVLRRDISDFRGKHHYISKYLTSTVFDVLHLDVS